MRIWYYQLLPYLPDAQFKWQLRELVAIMHDWRDAGKTNHLLINRVMQYPKSELEVYWFCCENEYERRYGRKQNAKYRKEFRDFTAGSVSLWPDEEVVFEGWHNKEYLRVCMANLYEKHFFGIGKSRITDEEWQRLCEGYKQITGEEYKI
jgi:uncharacterized protein (TIGR02328 family)